MMLVLGLLLGLVLALAVDALADGVPQFVHGAEIAQVLRELVVQLRQFLAPDALHHGVETDGLARQPLLAVILGVGDVEFLFLPGRQAAEVLGEGLEACPCRRFRASSRRS